MAKIYLRDWKLLNDQQRQKIVDDTTRYLIDVMKHEGLRLIEAEDKAKRELGISANVMADITTTKEFKTQYAHVKTYKRNAQAI